MARTAVTFCRYFNWKSCFNEISVLSWVDFISSEIALATALSKPVVANSSQPREASRRELYPNVYDALAEARQNSAYVGGSKVRVVTS